MAQGTGAPEVERMTAGDVSAVAAIEAIAFPRVTLHTEPSAETRLREELVRPWSHQWVVRDGSGSAVAFLQAWHVADEVQVLNVATHPTARGRGAATALLGSAIAFARAKRARKLFLEVRRSNEAAIRIYRRAGFFVMNLRRRYYPDGEDALEMGLSLDPITFSVERQKDAVNVDG